MHTSLIAHYEKMFAFKQYHGWSISELEDMMPWEMDVMVSFLNNYIELQELQKKQAAANR